MAMGDGVEDEEEKDTEKGAPDRSQAPAKGGPKDKKDEKGKDKKKK